MADERVISSQDKPDRGCIRIRSGGTAHSTKIEVYDGAEWLALRFVTAVQWEIDGPDHLARIFLTMRPIWRETVDLLTTADRVALELIGAMPPDPEQAAQT